MRTSLEEEGIPHIFCQDLDVEGQGGRWAPWKQGLKTHFANFSV